MTMVVVFESHFSMHRFKTFRSGMVRFKGAMGKLDTGALFARDDPDQCFPCGWA